MTRTTGGWRRALLAAPMVILASLSAPQVMAGSVVEVGNCVPNIVQFATIQGAVNAVPPGSVIKICPANYPEQVVVNKNLTLTGVKSGTTDNPVLVIPLGGFVPNTTSLASGHPIAAQILVQSPATAVTISNLAVDGSNNNLNSGCGDAPDRYLLPERLRNGKLCRRPRPGTGRSKLWLPRLGGAWDFCPKRQSFDIDG